MSQQLNRRPMSSRPGHGSPVNKKKTDSESLKDITESESIDSKSITSKGKYEFLDSIVGANQKDNFEDLIKEEAARIDLINKQKKKLNDINLLENKEEEIKELYKWETLFNNSKPISCYTKLNNKNYDPKLSKTFTDFKSPNSKIKTDIINTDSGSGTISKKNINNYNSLNTEITSSSKNNLAKSANKTPEKDLTRNHTTKSMPKKLTVFGLMHNHVSNNRSMYHSRQGSNKKGHKKDKKDKLDKFKDINVNAENPKNPKFSKNRLIKLSDICDFDYDLPKDLSCYNIESLRPFVHKEGQFEARVVSRPDKLKSAVERLHKKDYREIMYKRLMSRKQSLLISRTELITAINGNNAVPMLKSIFRQSHPNEVDDNKEVKLYLNTDKPLGKDDGKVDYTVNDRRKHIEEFIRLRDIANKRKQNSYGYETGIIGEENDMIKMRNVKTSTYDENDPLIKKHFPKLDEISVGINVNRDIKSDAQSIQDDGKSEEEIINAESNPDISFNKIKGKKYEKNIITTNGNYYQTTGETEGNNLNQIICKDKSKDNSKNKSKNKSKITNEKSNNNEVIDTGFNENGIYTQNSSQNDLILIEEGKNLSQNKQLSSLIKKKRPMTSNPGFLRPLTCVPIKKERLITAKPSSMITETNNSNSKESSDYNNLDHITTLVNELNNNYVPTKYMPKRQNSAVPSNTYKRIKKNMDSKKDRLSILLTQQNIKEYYEASHRRRFKNIENEFATEQSSGIGDNYKNRRKGSRPQTAFSNKAIINGLNEISTGGTQRDNDKIKYIFFNDYIDTTFGDNFKKDLNRQANYFYPPFTCSHNFTKYFYSSANNAVVKKKRKEEDEFIKMPLYTKKQLNIKNESEIYKIRTRSAKLQIK